MAFKLSGKEAWQFPPPLDVWRSLREGFADGSFLAGLAASLWRVSYGFALTLALGIGAGVVMASNRFAEWLAGPLILGIQSLPSICWLPVAIFWFGLGEDAILFIVVMGSFGSITMATRAMLRPLDKKEK